MKKPMTCQSKTLFFHMPEQHRMKVETDDPDIFGFLAVGGPTKATPYVWEITDMKGTLPDTRTGGERKSADGCLEELCNELVKTRTEYESKEPLNHTAAYNQIVKLY